MTVLKHTHANRPRNQPANHFFLKSIHPAFRSKYATESHKQSKKRPCNILKSCCLSPHGGRRRRKNPCAEKWGNNDLRGIRSLGKQIMMCMRRCRNAMKGQPRCSLANSTTFLKNRSEGKCGFKQPLVISQYPPLSMKPGISRLPLSVLRDVWYLWCHRLLDRSFWVLRSSDIQALASW